MYVLRVSTKQHVVRDGRNYHRGSRAYYYGIHPFGSIISHTIHMLEQTQRFRFSRQA